MEHPDLPALNDTIKKSKRWMEAAAKLMNGLQFETTSRRRLSVTLHHLCIEHHTAIHTLVDHHVWGSAFALLRPQLEAYVRGSWFSVCASEADIDRFYEDKDPPPFKVMIGQLEASGRFSESLKNIHAASWKQLCGLTHGGAIHVAGRNTANEIVARYEPREVTKLIMSSTLLSIAGCSGIGRAVDSPTLASWISDAYEGIYGEALLSKDD